MSSMKKIIIKFVISLADRCGFRYDSQCINWAVVVTTPLVWD